MLVSQMAKYKMSILFEDKKVVVRFKDISNLVAQVTEEQGLYRLSAMLVQAVAPNFGMRGLGT